MAIVPHLGIAGGVIWAIRIDWAVPGSLSPLRVWAADEADLWLRKRNDIMVFNLSSIPCNGQASGVVAPSCIAAAASHCVAATAPSGWLAWENRIDSAQLQTLDGASASLRSVGLQHAETCLRRSIVQGFSDLVAVEAGAREVATFMLADGSERPPGDGPQRFDAAFDMVIGATWARTTQGGGARGPLTGDRSAYLRSCLRTASDGRRVNARHP